MEVTRSVQIALVSGIIFCLLSVAIGAFAAHGLKSLLNEHQLGIFETAAKYQMYHGLALIMVGLFGMLSASKLQFVNVGFVGGVLCFSGSLYLLALLELRWLAFITPVGGVLLMLGWSAFLFQALSFFKSLKTESKL
ncbi:DUF423 domain-containing protein [Glaciecola sp. SC05]|uniref:DUF423 domain-containing protein n=1 Tax=Glaciecola sp. SC05 TaxID=1987355 RepID=UPI003528ABA0